MLLIGLHGARRSGKSTVARYLVEQYGFAEVSFAAPLYRAISTMFGIDIQDLQADDLKEVPIPWLNEGRDPRLPPITPRYLLQTLGTEWGRELVGIDLWLLIGARAIAKAEKLGRPGVVVSDVRFDNEAELILNRGGELWGVSRLARAPGVDGHASEAGIDTNYPSKGIVNHASFGSLYKRVDELVEELMKVVEGME